MTWVDRIREAAYTSPSGVRVVFDYENVKKSITKKTTGYEFPDADGTFVQDLGHSGRRYPLRVFFWGDDYDLTTDIFENALLERGIGKLEHPVYGPVDVVPFGSITRRDDLKTAANQSIVEVTFWETIGLVYPSSQTDPSSSVQIAVSEYNAAASEEFADMTSLDSVVEQTSLKGGYQSLLDVTTSGLKAVAASQDDVRKQFDAIVSSLNTGLDILVDDPLTLAFQTVLMIQSPARALTSIEARLDAYKNLISSIVSGEGAVVSPGNDSKNSNQFHNNSLYASTYVTGSITSVVNNQFTTKPDAIAAAERILDQFDTVTNWRDDNFKSLDEVDTGSAYQQLQEAVAITAGFLVEISFSLKQERRIVLDRDRTIVDLVAELYGSVDDQLDFLISSNDFSGDEIKELPEGREIVYYL